MLAFFTTGNLEELIEIQDFTRATTPTFWSFMENRGTGVMTTDGFSSRSTRGSSILPDTSTSTTSTGGTFRNRNRFIILFFNFRYLLCLLFLLGLNSNRCRCFRLLAVYFYTVISNMSLLFRLFFLLNSRLSDRLCGVATKGTARKSKELVEIGDSLFTTGPAL